MPLNLFFGKYKEQEGPWHYGIFFQRDDKTVTHICSSKKACSVYHDTPHNLTCGDFEFANIEYNYQPHIKQDVIFEYRARVQEAIRGSIIPFIMAKVLGEIRHLPKRTYREG